MKFLLSLTLKPSVFLADQDPDISKKFHQYQLTLFYIYRLKILEKMSSETGNKISAKDVDQQHLVKALAAFLKKYFTLKIWNNCVIAMFKDWQTQSASMERLS